MNSSLNQARHAEAAADDRRHDDEQEQRCAIVGDHNGHWLIRRVESLCQSERVFRMRKPMCFSFLAEGGTAFESQARHSEDVTAIDMPAGSVVTKVEGQDFSTWVFRVDNGCAGSDRLCMDIAYREISTGDHLLYLKAVRKGEFSAD